MAGHSKWSKIKRKKGANDQKKGALYTKLIREITVAAKEGGADPEANHRLRRAIADAKSQAMPNDNIERAIQKAAGDSDSAQFEEIVYEGYGPNGVAVMVKTLTDNRNRTVADVRHLFSKRGGNLGENGCVSWMFNLSGFLSFQKEKYSEEKLMEAALEAGAQDFIDAEDSWEVYTSPEHLDLVEQTLKKQNFIPDESNLSMIPENTIRLNLEDAKKAIALIDALDELDDVQKVYSNMELDPEVLKELE